MRPYTKMAENSEKGSITIRRPIGIKGFLGDMQVLLDDQSYGELYPGDQKTYKLPPGEHSLYVMARGIYKSETLVIKVGSDLQEDYIVHTVNKNYLLIALPALLLVLLQFLYVTYWFPAHWDFIKNLPWIVCAIYLIVIALEIRRIKEPGRYIRLEKE